MTVLRGFESFADIIDTFVKSEVERYSDMVSNQTAMHGKSNSIYRTIPVQDGQFLSSIRDVNDNVMYFMVGVDRVNGPTKIGV